MLRFSYKKCCSPTVFAHQSHRDFVVSLSRLFLLGFAFFSSLCLLFKRSFRNLRRRARSTTENRAALPTFAVLTAFFAFFTPDWKKPNVSCETFGFFLLSSSLFRLFALLRFTLRFSLFLAFVFFPVFFSSFYAFLGAFFCFLRFSGEFWAYFS